MEDKITLGKTTIISFPEYFEIKDRKNFNKTLLLVASGIFLSINLFDFYENNFEIAKVGIFKVISTVLWLVILAIQLRVNAESKIEKSKIKEIIARKNKWNTVVISYDNKKRGIEGFSEGEQQEIIKFLMNNR